MFSQTQHRYNKTKERPPVKSLNRWGTKEDYDHTRSAENSQTAVRKPACDEEETLQYEELRPLSFSTAPENTTIHYFKHFHPPVALDDTSD